MVKRNEQVFETRQHDKPVDILKDITSHSVQFSSFQSLSRVRIFETPCMPDLPVHQLLELTQTKVH